MGLRIRGLIKNDFDFIGISLFIILLLVLTLTLAIIQSPTHARRDYAFDLPLRLIFTPCVSSHLFRILVPKGSRVLEIGNNGDDPFASLKESRGVRVDFSPEMIALARQNHPGMVI